MPDFVPYYEGVGDMYAAQMLTEETPSTPAVYGPVMLLGKGVSYKVAARYKEGVKYASNVMTRNAKRLDGYDVEVELDRIIPAAQAMLEGRVADANGVSRLGGAQPPYVAIMFSATLDDDSSELWVMYKGKFGAPDAEYKTREDKLEFQSPTIKGAFYNRHDLGIPGMCCETGDEAVADSVKNGWYAAPYVPVTTYTILVLQQPADLALTVGEIGEDAVLTAAFDVSDGSTPAYQWYSNLTDSNVGGSAIVGATGPGYAIPADKTAGTYYYYCAASYEGVTAKSNAATVTVAAA